MERTSVIATNELHRFVQLVLFFLIVCLPFSPPWEIFALDLWNKKEAVSFWYGIYESYAERCRGEETKSYSKCMCIVHARCLSANCIRCCMRLQLLFESVLHVCSIGVHLLFFHSLSLSHFDHAHTVLYVSIAQNANLIALNIITLGNLAIGETFGWS